MYRERLLEILEIDGFVSIIFRERFGRKKGGDYDFEIFRDFKIVFRIVIK